MERLPLEPVSRRSQHQVALVVSEYVVDLLEMVKIDEQ